MITMPNLRPGGPWEAVIVGALSGVAGAIILPVWSWLGAVALIPCAFWLASEAIRGARNGRSRARWADRFGRRVTPRQLAAVVAADPGQYVVHARTFGGTDGPPLRPMVELEDRATGERAAVHPPGWRTVTRCRRLGAEVVEA